MYLLTKVFLDLLNNEICQYKKSQDPAQFAKIENDLSVYTYFHILDKTAEEDYALEFFYVMRKKFKEIVTAYIPGKSLFTTYYNTAMFTAYKLFKKNKQKAECRQRINESFVVREKQVEMADSVLLDDGRLFVSENEIMYGGQMKISRHDAMDVLALLLYVSPVLDDKVVMNMAEILGMDYMTLSGMVLEAAEDFDSKAAEVDKHRRLRNFYYEREQTLAQKKNAFSLNEEESRILAGCRHKQAYHIKCINALSRVSHRKIAGILGVEYEKVRGMIYRAKKILEQILAESGKQ